MVALGPARQHEQERGGLRIGQQALEELERGDVRPVQVLERDRDRPVLGEAPEDPAHDLERPELEGLGRELAEPALGLRLQREAEHRAEVRVHLQAFERRTAAPPVGAAPRGHGAPARRPGHRATTAAGRGTASTASTRRTTRIGPRSTARGRARRSPARPAVEARRAAGSCRSPARR